VELNRDLYIRLKFLSMLSACSWKLTQKGISESIGISSTTASKYVNGVFLPSTKRAQKLMAELSEICSMESLLKEALSSGPLTYPEVLNVTSKDVSLILWLPWNFWQRLRIFSSRKFSQWKEEGR